MRSLRRRVLPLSCLEGRLLSFTHGGGTLGACRPPTGTRTRNVDPHNHDTPPLTGTGVRLGPQGCCRIPPFDDRSLRRTGGHYHDTGEGRPTSGTQDPPRPSCTPHPVRRVLHCTSSTCTDRSVGDEDVQDPATQVDDLE